MKKKLLSVLLVLVMVAGLLPAMAQPASAASEKTGITQLSNDVYDTLNIETETESLQEQADSDLTPYGKGILSLHSINELVFIGNGGNGTGYDISDNEKAYSRWSETVKRYKFADSDAYRSVAFDPIGSGKADYIATVSATLNDKGMTNITLSIDSKEPVPYGKPVMPLSIPLSELPFKVYPENAGAWLSIAAGNFDGDEENTQEIAVYRPYAGNNTYNDTESCYSGSIEIFRFAFVPNPAPLFRDKIMHSVSTTALGPRPGDNDSVNIPGYELISVGNYDLSKQSAWYFPDNIGLFAHVYLGEDTGSDWTYMYRFPALSLETVSQPANDADDLCITFCSPLGGGVAKETASGDEIRATRPYDCATGVFFWTDPLAGGKKTSTTYMRFNWEEDYKVSVNLDKNAAKKNEVMVFGGAGAGDIDGDGAQEVVVAGYAMKNRDQTMDGKDKDDWKISTDEYLATYFTYDPGRNTYNHVGQAPNWVSMKKADYSGASALNEGIFSTYGEKDMAHCMLPVTCFAERGTGHPESVAISGIICLRDDKSGVSKWTPFSDNGLGTYSFQSGAFNPRYTIPTEPIHETFGHGVQNRLFTETAAGNFDGNMLGLEQLAFVYVAKVKEESKWSSAYGIIGQRINGDSDYAYNIKDKKSRYLAKDIRFNYWISQSKDKNYAPASVCAADIDNDSTLMRFSGEPNEYFFSDPRILAVLQAAPYYSEIDYTDVGETSITFTEGSSSEEEHGLTVGMQMEIGASVGFMYGLAEYSITFKTGISTEFEHTWGTGSSKSYSLSYAAGEENSVALVMTPFVRYHYEAYNPATKKWEPICVDSPQSPRASLITVEKYDAVAEANGWSTISGNILKNTAGIPATYDSSELGKDNFEGGQAVGAKTGSNFVKVGSGDSAGAMAQTISAEDTSFKNMAWNVTATLSTEIQQGQGYIGLSASAGYTGASSRANFSGYDYVGEVTNIPAGYEDYSFAWRFGVWSGNSTVQGEKQDFPVLGFLVKDVMQPPVYPANFHVAQATANSLDLSWQAPNEAIPINLRNGTYTLYRYHHGVYYPLFSTASTEAKDGWFSFTDENVAPYQEYQYALQTRVISYGRYTLSPYSPLLDAYTLPDGTVPIAELEVKGPLTLQTGGSRELSVKVTPVQGENVGATVLQWQRYEPEDGGWQNVVGAQGTQDTITLRANDAPERIRCQVSQRVGTEILTVYTKEIPVEVKAPSSSPARTTPQINVVVVGNDKGYAIADGDNPSYPEELTWDAGSYMHPFSADTAITLWVSGSDNVTSDLPGGLPTPKIDTINGGTYYKFTMPDGQVTITIQ